MALITQSCGATVPFAASRDKHIILQRNVSLASQLKAQNCIYEVTADFDLAGATLSLPEKSTLYFNGGSFSNGVLKGNMSTIAGITTSILNLVRLQGTWTNADSDLDWWGCVPYDAKKQVDNSASIQCALESTINTLRVSKLYGISSPLEAPGSMKLIGTNSKGFKQAGFVANSNFNGRSMKLSRDGKTYMARGMIVHFYDKHPWLEDITFDANKAASFAVEQLAGYSHCDMDNVYICNALRAGILQYGAEQPYFTKVCVRDCHIGILVSTTRFQDTDMYVPTGDYVSMCNLVNLSGCDVVGCNYGIIINGGSNVVLDDCKTAYNSVCGLMILGTTAMLRNYYTEGDGLCNFWFDGTPATKTAPTQNKAYSHKVLTSKQQRRDGFASRINTLYDEPVFYRAPVFIRTSNVQVYTAFMSVKPRGKEETNVRNIVEPTPGEIQYGGVDAFFVVEESGLLLENIKTYLHSSNSSANAYPFSFAIDLTPSNVSSAGSRIQMIGNIRENGGYAPTVYSTGGMKPAAGSDCFYMQSDRYEARRSYYSVASTVNDYNADMKSRLYGTTSRYRFADNLYKESFNGFPLFQKTKSGYLFLSMDEIAAKFAGKRQVKMVAYVKVLKEFSGIIQFNAGFTDKNYGNLKIGNALNASTCTFKPGIYRLEMPVFLSPKTSLGIDKSWRYMRFALYGDKTADENCLYSDIYFYDMEDGQMLPYYGNVNF